MQKSTNQIVVQNATKIYKKKSKKRKRQKEITSKRSGCDIKTQLQELDNCIAKKTARQKIQKNKSQQCAK